MNKEGDVVVWFNSSSLFISKRGGRRSRFSPFGGWVHPSLPPYTCGTVLNPVWAWVRVLRTQWVHTQLGTEFLELPLACCRCSKFMPKTI